MSETCRPLIEVLAEIEDPRHARGRRHPFVAILALAVVATLCGAKGYVAIAEWGRNYGGALAHALGFTRPKTPCASTFFLALRDLDRPTFERVIGQWAEQVLAATPRRKGEWEALAIDGIDRHFGFRCQRRDLHGDRVRVRRGVVRHDQQRRLARTREVARTIREKGGTTCSW